MGTCSGRLQPATYTVGTQPRTGSGALQRGKPFGHAMACPYRGVDWGW